LNTASYAIGEDYHHYGPFVRTRRVPSMGFDLVMTENELRHERSILLDWVACNAPKRRKKTVSVPEMVLEVAELDECGTFLGDERNHYRRPKP